MAAMLKKMPAFFHASSYSDVVVNVSVLIMVVMFELFLVTGVKMEPLAWADSEYCDPLPERHLLGDISTSIIFYSSVT